MLVQKKDIRSGLIYIAKDIESQNKQEDIPYMRGDIIYSLRNNTLYASSFDIDGNKFDIQNIELLLSNPKSASAKLSYGKVVYHYKNGEEIREDRYLCINIMDLIRKICNAAKYYYQENKEKFEFMNNRIVVVDKETLKTLGVKDTSLWNKSLTYCNSYSLDKDKTKLPILWEDEGYLLAEFKN